MVRYTEKNEIMNLFSQIIKILYSISV